MRMVFSDIICAGCVYGQISIEFPLFHAIRIPTAPGFA